MRKLHPRPRGLGTRQLVIPKCIFSELVHIAQANQQLIWAPHKLTLFFCCTLVRCNLYGKSHHIHDFMTFRLSCNFNHIKRKLNCLRVVRFTNLNRSEFVLFFLHNQNSCFNIRETVRCCWKMKCLVINYELKMSESFVQGLDNSNR